MNADTPVCSGVEQCQSRQFFAATKLRRAQSLWPQATIGVYRGRLRLQTKLVHDWIDLDFVAKRTKCIGSLIYFPFVLIALLIVPQHRLRRLRPEFDDPHRARDQPFYCFQLRDHVVLGSEGRTGRRQAKSDGRDHSRQRRRE